MQTFALVSAFGYKERHTAVCLDIKRDTRRCAWI